MVASRCPLCGYLGPDFSRTADRRLVCPRCGEVAGEAGAKPVDVEEKTLTVGTALAGVGLVTLLGSIGWLLIALFAAPPAPQPAPGQDPDAARAMVIGIYIGQFGPAVIGLPLGVIQVAGGIQLARRRTWAVAVVGAIMALVPCSCGFVVGLPIGIWALVVLFNPAVRAAFR
jgi:hypothetical protein